MENLLVEQLLKFLFWLASEELAFMSMFLECSMFLETSLFS